MADFAKGILIAMLAAVGVVIVMNLAFFLPWYITVVETAFEVSQVVANENYLPYDTYYDIYDQLKEKPIFEKRNDSDELSIKVTHYNGKNGIETRRGMSADDYYDMSASSKPYVQMGETATITVKATYPFQMNLMGKEVVVSDLPVEMTLKTTTLKHYKDLPYYMD